MLIFNGITVLVYLLGAGFMASILPTIPIWAFYVLGILAILNITFTIFLFKWKRWAFFAICGMAGIVFIINLLIGVNIFSSIFGLSGPIILYLIMRSRWNLFE
jgi:hypothetical protein